MRILKIGFLSDYENADDVRGALDDHRNSFMTDEDGFSCISSDNIESILEGLDDEDEGYHLPLQKLQAWMSENGLSYILG